MRNLLLIFSLGLLTTACSIDASLQSQLASVTNGSGGSGGGGTVVAANNIALHGPGPSGSKVASITTGGGVYKVSTSVGDFATDQIQVKSGYKVRTSLLGTTGSLMTSN